MGSTRSTDAFYGNVPLKSQAVPFAAIGSRFCAPDIVRICAKNNAFTDANSGKVVFRTGSKQQPTRLLDADGETVVTLKELARYAQAAYAPATYKDEECGGKLFRVFLKIGELTLHSFEDTQLRVVFSDPATGAHCNAVMDGEWRGKVAHFWLDRGGARARELVAKVYRPLRSLRRGYVLEVAGNVDCALLVLVCALLDDALRKHRLERNRRVTNPQLYAKYLYV